MEIKAVLLSRGEEEQEYKSQEISWDLQ